MRQHKKIFPLFFLFLLLSIFIISFIPQVKATTTYEWIQNNGFEDGSGNLLPNFGWDEGTFGYWNHSAAVQVISTQHYSGSYCVDLIAAGNQVCYQFNTPINGSFINSFTLFAKWLGSGNDLEVIVDYNDTTISNSGAISVSTSWVQYNFTSLINTAKFIDEIHIAEHIGSGYSALYIDDVYLGIIGTGQTVITATTSPWRDNDYDNDDIFQGISIGTYYTGIASYYAGYSEFSLVQYINYLDSNTISNVSLWSKPTVSGLIRIYLGYSDGSFSHKDISSGTIGIWNQLTFSGFVLPNKLVISIVINIINSPYGYTNLDDISLLATIPYNQAVFSFSISPTPISITNVSFIAYQRSGYVFSGYVIGANGSIQGSGTFSVLSTKGTQTGNITGGTFNFPISERIGVGIFYESFFIDIIMVTGNFTNFIFTIKIQATWQYVAAETPPIVAPPESYDSWYSNLVVTYMILFIFIVVPPLIIAFEFSKHGVDPFMGFIGGLCLTVPIAYIVHIIDLWVLFVFVLGLILMILAKLGAFNRF